MSQHRTLNALHPLQDFHLRIQEDLHLARFHVQALELIDQDLSALTDRLKALMEGQPSGLPLKPGGLENPPFGEGCQPFGLGGASSDHEQEVWAVLQEVDDDGNPVEDEVRSAGEVIQGQEEGEGAILDGFEARADFGPLH